MRLCGWEEVINYHVQRIEQFLKSNLVDLALEEAYELGSVLATVSHLEGLDPKEREKLVADGRKKFKRLVSYAQYYLLIK